VEPGGKVSDIQVRLDGADELTVNTDDELVLTTEEGIVKMSAPYAYQIVDGEETPVDVSYSIDGDIYGFDVGTYDTSKTLYIDPAYISSYFGEGKTRTVIADLTKDTLDNIYLTGSVYSSTFPTTTGPVKSGTYDMFVTKMDKDFTGIIASTFVGGTVTTYEYDELNRVKTITDDINIREYIYDNVSDKLTVQTKELGTLNLLKSLEYEFDENSRVKKYTDEEGNILTYTYYPNGELKTITYPGNKVVTYTYNDANQMETVTDWNNNVTTYVYDVNGRLSSMTRPNGSIESYDYYKNGWLKSKVDKKSNNDIISECNFTYDGVGNILTETGNNSNITNIYSDLYQLVDQAKKDDNQTVIYERDFTYDTTGNMLTMGDENGPVDSIVYDDGNIINSFNTNSVVYDNDGNMTSGPLNGQMTNFTYNSRSQLTSVDNTTYEYDAEGRRKNVTESGDTTEFIVNPLAGYNQVLIKTDSSGNDTYYVYGLGLISQETNNVSSYYHFDFRGSTVAITTPMETILDTFEYDPYGNVLTRAGTSDVIFEFNGKYGVVTDDNGLVFMMTRYYNKDIKRFINRDSLYGSIDQLLSMNQHLFGYGNPVKYMDPTGLTPAEDIEDMYILIYGQEYVDNMSEKERIAMYLTNMSPMTDGASMFDEPADSQIRIDDINSRYPEEIQHLYWIGRKMGPTLQSILVASASAGDLSRSLESSMLKEQLVKPKANYDNLGSTNELNSAQNYLKGSSQSVDNIISNAIETTSGSGIARNFESTGGFNQTLADFDSLNPVNVKEITTQYGTGKYGILSDGTKLVARPGSMTGGATLEIKISNKIIYKIRY